MKPTVQQMAAQGLAISIHETTDDNEYHTTEYPTSILYAAGAEKARSVGVLTAAELTAWLQGAAAKYRNAQPGCTKAGCCPRTFPQLKALSTQGLPTR
jgi:hypothetical protein